MSSDEIDKSTEQVLEYYKKYSQNRNLPKYFSGTSVSYLPPIDIESNDEQNDKSFEKKPAQSSYQSNHPIDIPEIKIVVNQPKDISDGSPSASSSLESPSAEHKKLEWDNGADIGYNSARNNSELQLRRSSSLPIFDNLKGIKPNVIIPLTKPSTTNKALTSSGNVVILNSPSSSDVSKKSVEKVSSSSTTTTEGIPDPSSSSTSSSNAPVNANSTSLDTDESRFEDFQKSLAFLKHRFGIPDAQSTPYFVVSKKNTVENVTPLTTKVRQKASRSKSEALEANKMEMQKVDRPCAPSKKEEKKSGQPEIETRSVELSMTTPTLNDMNCSALDSAPIKSQTIQIEEFSQPKSGSQLEYKTGAAQQQQEQQASTSKPNVVSMSEDSASSFEYFSVNKDIMQIQKPPVENLSKDDPIVTLSEKILLSESGNDSRTEDIDRLLETFNKLLKTKKMNSTTKKKYMKKVFREFCQIESSGNSTTSSDLFFPKKDFKESTPVVASPAASRHTKRSHKSSIESGSITESECQQCIEEIECIIKVSPSDSEPDKSETTKEPTAKNQTNTSESINAIPSSGGSTHPPTDAQLATFPKASESETASKDLSKKPSSETEITQTIRQDQVVPGDIKISTGDIKISKANYKLSRTDSNKAITASTSPPRSDSQLSIKSSGGSSLTFAEKERNYQLNWINSEINHLSKIKSILEKTKNKPSRTQKHIYNITEKYGSLDRNFVIKTSVPEDQNVNNYIINGKEYVVSGSGKSVDSDEPYKADIELNYNEYETNIAIRSVCLFCKKVECLCSKAPLDPKLSSSKTNFNFCLYCKQPVCCCAKTKYVEGKNVVAAEISPRNPDKPQEICLSCQLVDCGCQKQKDLLEDKDSQIFLSGTISSKEASRNGSYHSHTASSARSSDTSNSLKKVFKKCQCTIADPSCSCFFVKKLLDRFQMPRPISGLHKEVQPSSSGRLNSLSRDKCSSWKHSRVGNVSDVPSSCKTSQTKSDIIFTQTRNSVPNMDKETFTSTEKMEQEINTGLPKKSEELEEQEKKQYSAPSKNSSTNHRFDSEVFTNYETAKSKSSVDKFYKNVQVQADEKLDENLTIEPPNTEDKATGNTGEKICSKCQKCRSKSANEKTNVPTPESENTSSNPDYDSKNSPSFRITCYCCKQKAFSVEVSYLKKGNDFMPYCSRCYYKRPGHCFHPKDSFQRWQNDQNGDGIQFCSRCRVDDTESLRRPESLAYTLILPDHNNLKQRRRSSKSCLGNIKVQKGWSRKSFKNQENYDRKWDDQKNSLGRERRKETEKDDSGRAKRKKKSRTNTDVKEKNNLKKEDEAQYTLMEYLIQNRPHFILSAEYRRQMLLNSRILRERQRDALKINFLANNPRQSNKEKYKLFTEKEMRDINKRNYQKLPEVQGRLINQRDIQLRQADRLISNSLAKRVQKSILKGKGSFPLDKALTN